jgi:hypothetical protein
VRLSWRTLRNPHKTYLVVIQTLNIRYEHTKAWQRIHEQNRVNGLLFLLLNSSQDVRIELLAAAIEIEIETSGI